MTEKTFEFEHDGKKYLIPAFASLPMGAIRKGRKGENEADKAFIILEETLGEDSKQLTAIDKMDSKAFQEFLTGWTQGAGVGEAQDS